MFETQLRTWPRFLMILGSVIVDVTINKTRDLNLFAF